MAKRTQRVRLIFSNSHLPFSYGVRLVTWSHWSHVGLLIDDHTVIESTFSHHGVKISTLDDFKSRAQHWCIAEIDVNDAQATMVAAKSQLDKPYDYTAIAGILFHRRNWQEDDAWFCSELVAYAIYTGGTVIGDPSKIHAFTPQDLWMCIDRVIAMSA